MECYANVIRSKTRLCWKLHSRALTIAISLIRLHVNFKCWILSGDVSNYAKALNELPKISAYSRAITDYSPQKKKKKKTKTNRKNPRVRFRNHIPATNFTEERERESYDRRAWLSRHACNPPVVPVGSRNFRRGSTTCNFYGTMRDERRRTSSSSSSKTKTRQAWQCARDLIAFACFRRWPSVAIMWQRARTLSPPRAHKGLFYSY